MKLLRAGGGRCSHDFVPDVNHSYLIDAQGRQVTPLAKTSGVPDPLPLHAGKGPTRAYHRAHGNMTPEAKAKAEKASLRFHALRAAEAHSDGTDVNKTAEWMKDSEDEDSRSESASDDDVPMAG